MYKLVSIWLCAGVWVRVWLNEVPDGYTGQADVCLWGLAEVDGVAVQANVLQRISDVVKVVQVAERVLVHHLNVVTLQQKIIFCFSRAGNKKKKKINKLIAN